MGGRRTNLILKEEIVSLIYIGKCLKCGSWAGDCVHTSPTSIISVSYFLLFLLNRVLAFLLKSTPRKVKGADDGSHCLSRFFVSLRH